MKSWIRVLFVLLASTCIAAPTTRPNVRGRKKPALPATSGPVRAKYEPVTPEEAAAADAQARSLAERVAAAFERRIIEVETEHFLCFTDWPMREHVFLRDNLESAYELVAGHFDLDPKENIFIGKLPVFMFDRQADMIRFAKEIDRFDAPQTVAGYHHDSGNGRGHMAMFKPSRVGNDGAAEREWGRVLLHEFVHAFVARYHTNDRVPRWLNEGTAELISYDRFRRPSVRSAARTKAQSRSNFLALFDDEKMPDGEMYPVVQTMVEMMASTNRAKFIEYFMACKDGEDPEAAMRRLYGVDYNGFIAAWRKYAAKLNG